MEKNFNLILYGFRDINKELNFSKYKLLYNKKFPIDLSNKSQCIISDKDEILLIASHSQIVILNKKRKNPNLEIVKNLPYIRKIDNDYNYNLYIPLLNLTTNEELIAYYKCSNIINYNNLSEHDLYNDLYLKPCYLDLFFKKISKKEFIKCQD